MHCIGYLLQICALTDRWRVRYDTLPTNGRGPLIIIRGSRLRLRRPFLCESDQTQEGTPARKAKPYVKAIPIRRSAAYKRDHLNGFSALELGLKQASDSSRVSKERTW